MRLAIIPARGGSKRIPRKNIKDFHGKPIIAYSIHAAINSGCFDKVIVSTDDNEIAYVAKQYGADVPFIRPVNISDDHATTLDVIQHALIWCEQQKWEVSDACCIYATAPFLDAKDLARGLDLLQLQNVMYAFSATSFAFPIQRALKVDHEFNVSMFMPENEQVRSQDLEEAYHDAGQFYWGKADAFNKKLPIFLPHSKAVLIPRHRAQDIDTNDDWEYAKLLFSIVNK